MNHLNIMNFHVMILFSMYYFLNVNAYKYKREIGQNELVPSNKGLFENDTYFLKLLSQGEQNF